LKARGQAIAARLHITVPADPYHGGSVPHQEVVASVVGVPAVSGPPSMSSVARAGPSAPCVALLPSEEKHELASLVNWAKAMWKGNEDYASSFPPVSFDDSSIDTIFERKLEKSSRFPKN